MQEITIGRLRGGYCVSWQETGKRRRYQLKARTRKEAEAEGRLRYMKESIGSSKLTVSEIWEKYREYLGDKPTSKTMRYTGKPIKAHFGSMTVEIIKIQDSRDYTKSRLKEGRKVGTVWTELGHLRSALLWADSNGLVEKAPHIELPSKPDSDIRPLVRSEIRKLINNCAAPHQKLAVILLFATGARVGAVLDRQWKHIDFRRGTIDLRLDDGVTRKGRAIVPMNKMARTALEEAYAARQTDWVVEYNGAAIKSMRTGFYSALKRAEIQGVNIHQIRHTVAVQMLEAGETIEKVSDFLGHSNIHITKKIYARFQPEHLASAATALDFLDDS
ncbi:site-specific integrase [Ruegeria sp. HKCCSP346]|uniref:tyrosine-type recombinase/integrase n=1 Tax=Ruegeria sp. HKCCSP346 TaxID=2794830 RepID=UPI001AE505A9|nr:site-specific integrase [Ruegeria sp. HKCCSP346]